MTLVATLLSVGIAYAGTATAAPAEVSTGSQTPGPTAPANASAHRAQSISPATEAPKDLAILPWKNALKGKLPEGQLRLVEVPLEPIDPQVFRREIKLFNQESQHP